MAHHATLAKATNVRVYFCSPHSPWQRGTCENAKGLLRQYLPECTDLSIYTQDKLDAIADSRTTRPRVTHDRRTPMGVFSLALTNSQKRPRSVQ